MNKRQTSKAGTEPQVITPTCGREYKPERVVRRAGSERAGRLPSRVGNQLIWPQGARR